MGKITPFYDIVKTGELARFFCASATSVTWSFRGSTSLPGNVQPGQATSLGHMLVINEARLENSGEYTCFGRDEGNNEFESIALLEVTG